MIALTPASPKGAHPRTEFVLLEVLMLNAGIVLSREVLASRDLARAAGGETIEVTNRGRPVALLVPAHQDRWQDLVASGQVVAAATEGDLVDEAPGHYGIDASARLAATRDRPRHAAHSRPANSRFDEPRSLPDRHHRTPLFQPFARPPRRNVLCHRWLEGGDGWRCPSFSAVVDLPTVRRGGEATLTGQPVR